jgi:ribosome biogenesis GTPase
MIDLTDYGFMSQMMPDNTDGLPARITAVHKERYDLICMHGEVHGRLKSGAYFGNSREVFPTTGDFVMISYNPDGDSLITKTLERRSKFSRNDFSGHGAGYVKTIIEQVVAANFDYVFIMQSLNHDLNIKRLERYLTLAWQSGAVPVVLLTKADLVGDCTPQLYEIEKIAGGAGVFAVSARTGAGLDTLSQYLKPRNTIVFLGSSGVGKSSLVNALAGEEIMTVSEIRADDSRGRHTTTHRQLIMLKSGVMIIDTPGMRELGMWDVSSGLDEAFADVKHYFGRCRFNDCRHQSEPGCAIIAALEIGELSAKRWESYLQIEREAHFVSDKSSFLRGKEERFKTIAKWNRQNDKTGGRTNENH